MKRQKLDGIDAENISQVVKGAGWQLIRARIEKTLAAKRIELETPCDPVRTSELRGYIAGLKLALSVPDILISESKGKSDE